jgi:hypothetical protein
MSARVRTLLAFGESPAAKLHRCPFRRLHISLAGDIRTMHDVSARMI